MEANKVINDLKTQITELEQNISEKDWWLGQFQERLVRQAKNVNAATEKIEVLQEDGKKILDQLQENQDMNVSYLRKYAKSNPKQAGEKAGAANEIQNQTRNVFPCGKKPEPHV